MGDGNASKATGTLFGAAAAGGGAPESVFGRSFQQGLEIGYEAAGLKPTHGGFLPRGIGVAAPTYFAPQPIGIVDPNAVGLHHDWLFGVTYERLALLYTNPQKLEREIAEQKALPRVPVVPKRIRNRGDVGLFDYPILLFGGASEFLAIPRKPSAAFAKDFEAEALNQRAFVEEQKAFLSTAPVGLYPIIDPSGARYLVEVTSPGVNGFAGTFELDAKGVIVVTSIEPSSVLFQRLKLVLPGSRQLEKYHPTTGAAITNEEAAEGIRRELVAERADP